MKKSILNLVFFFVLMAIFSANLTSCSSKEEKFKEITSSENLSMSDLKTASKSEEPSSAGSIDKAKSTEQSNSEEKIENKDYSGSNKISSAVEKAPQKIIKTADISFEVKNYKDTRTAVMNLTKNLGGYIGNENQMNNNYQIENSMTIRVKSENFDKLVDGILSQAVKIDNKTINAEDVTSEFVDAEARLKSKKEAEEQFAQILKKANSINDILAVQEQLRAIREEIESYQGKLKYLNDKVNYCTINIKFYEKADYIPTPETGFFYRVSKAFVTGWQGVVAFFIGLIYLWPLILISFLTLYFIMKLAKRRKAKKLEKKQ
ncbi:MAG: DUF4349 domain-containing protein [Bacteroidetes bacterium]|nr:DUF4349 domain-containing protein [Bacteroidota bacterium]